jgi:hypothetical protein
MSYLGMGGAVDLRLDHIGTSKGAVLVEWGNHCLTCEAAKALTVKYKAIKYNEYK